MAVIEVANLLSLVGDSGEFQSLIRQTRPLFADSFALLVVLIPTMVFAREMHV